MMRNSMAVVAGFATWSVLWLAVGQVAQRVAPNAFLEDGSIADGALIVVLVASVICSLVAGALAATIARRAWKPVSLALGGILLIVGVGVQASLWTTLPLWYHLPFLALLLPMTVIGARLAATEARPVAHATT